MDYGGLSAVERLVLYEKYSQERMSEVNGVAAQVMASADPKAASEFLTRYVDEKFPETSRSKEVDIKKKMAELREFSKKQVRLVPGPDGFELEVKDKEG